MKCFCCGFEVEPLYESTDEKGMWNNGVVDKISANYGSRFNGESFLIAVCDNCIESRKERLNHIGNYNKCTHDYINKFGVDECQICGETL